jgi:acetyl-CoA C-acetyltransferase
MKLKQVFILSGSRTPMGSYGGQLSTLSAPELGSLAVKDAIEKANIPKVDIESIVMGNVLSANLGQAPARQVSMGAGLPELVCATTVNKVCASGMKAVSMVNNDILLSNIDLGIAGGMESMSGVPHYIPNARFGLGYGNSTLIDGLVKDGLTDAYHQTSMGISGDKTADKFNISRKEQDDFAEQSFRKAAKAWSDGSFSKEVIPVSIPQKKGEALFLSEDENYKKANFEKMRTLPSIFSKTGTVTAANASPINDGASALVIAGEDYVSLRNLRPVGRIIAYAEAEQDPLFFTTTPILAVRKVLKKANLTLLDMDFFEINEAFAVVPIAFMKELKIPIEKVNVLGGAIALGHPLGSSGCRILVTLINILQIRGGRFGLAAICNGGGGASAMILEKL